MKCKPGTALNLFTSSALSGAFRFGIHPPFDPSKSLRLDDRHCAGIHQGKITETVAVRGYQ
jgi:hypothetical protein